MTIMLMMSTPGLRLRNVQGMLLEALAPCRDRLEAPMSAAVEKLTGAVTTALRRTTN